MCLQTDVLIGKMAGGLREAAVLLTPIGLLKNDRPDLNYQRWQRPGRSERWPAPLK